MVNTTPVEDGIALLTEDLVNEIIVMLEIDNITVNAAHEGVTNAGGFVSVEDHETTFRDMDPYLRNAVYVTWVPEERWLHTDTIWVRYLEHGAEEFINITVEDVSDLSALYDRFPNARMEELADGSRRLILADDPADMPYKTHVDVRFIPTILVENTTLNNVSGTVAVEGGSYNNVRDGRYPKTLVFGVADEGYMVDMNYLQIGNVGDVHRHYVLNLNAVDLDPNGEGFFSSDVTLDIAGEKELMTITGKVTVLTRDTYGNPTSISISVDSLPSCLDIGIPFVKAKNPDDIPKTGDPMAYVAGFTGVSALALLLVHLGDKRKKKRS